MYRLQEVVLQNKTVKKKRLVITFTDPKMDIIATFLMTDLPLRDGIILQEIVEVLEGKIARVEGTGNRTGWEITQDQTIINDLYDQTDEATYIIDTQLLQKLAKEWLAAYQAFQKKQ